MTTDKNNSPVTAPMWWDGGDRAITAREKATIEEHGPSSFSIPLVQATALQPAGLAGQQGVAFVTDAMVDAACKILHDGYDHESRKAYREACQKAARQALEAALAATGKQQVGEVQGDARASLPLYRMADDANGKRGLHRDDTGSWVRLQDVERALAARQPGAQADEAAILRHGAAVLDMWEGDPNVTGYMGDFKDACAILEVLALHAAPPAQGIDLGQLRALAEKFESYGDDEIGDAFSGPYYQCAAELRGLIDGQRDAAPGVGNG